MYQAIARSRLPSKTLFPEQERIDAHEQNDEGSSRSSGRIDFIGVLFTGYCSLPEAQTFTESCGFAPCSRRSVTADELMRAHRARYRRIVSSRLTCVKLAPVMQPVAKISYHDIERIIEFDFVRATEAGRAQFVALARRGDQRSRRCAACDAMRGMFDLMNICRRSRYRRRNQRRSARHF